MFPPSRRVVGIVALNNYLALDCDLAPIDLGRGDQCTPEYAALNLNRKVLTLGDDGIVLWESNAILFYMASKRPESGVWPQDVMGQSDVLRCLFRESAHCDAKSVGMVAYEKGRGLLFHRTKDFADPKKNYAYVIDPQPQVDPSLGTRTDIAALGLTWFMPVSSMGKPPGK